LDKKARKGILRRWSRRRTLCVDCSFANTFA